MSTVLKRNFGLDLLRAIAISLVLISHCTFLLFPEANSFGVTFVRTMGAVGVDLFFVLSGYLIGGILLKIITEKEVSFNELFRFWKRRWLRTLPNYFLILLANIALAIVLGIDLPKSVILYFGFFQNFLYQHPNFFTEAWSLSVEEFAYLLLPFMIILSVLIFNKLNRKSLFVKVTVLVIILLTILKWKYFNSTVINNYQEWSGTFRKVVIYRIDSIYYGFLALYLIKSFPEYFKRFKNVLFFLGGSLFILLHFIIYC